MGASPVTLSSEELARKLTTGGGGEGLSSADLAAKLTTPTGPLPGSTPRLRAAVGAPEPKPEPGFFGQAGERLGGMLGSMAKDASINAAIGPIPAAMKTGYDILKGAHDEGSTGASRLGYVPIIGPMAGQLGRDIGERNYGGAAVQGAALGTTALGLASGLARGASGLRQYASEAPARASLKKYATRLEGETELTNMVRRDPTDESFRPNSRQALPYALDEISGGKGTKAGVKALEKLPEEQVFSEMARGADNAGKRALGYTLSEIESRGQQPIDLSPVRAEIRGQITDDFRAKFPTQATHLEQVAERYASRAVPREQAFKDLVTTNQQLEALEAKSPVERAKIIRADPEWGYLVGIKRILRDKVFEGLPKSALDQYQLYGKLANMRDQFQARATELEGNVQPGAMAAAQGGLETAGVGVGFGRAGTAIYGLSKAAKGAAGVTHPARQLISALKKIDYADPTPLAAPTMIRGLLPPGPVQMGPADIPPGNTGYAMPAELLRNQRSLPDAGAQIPLGPADIAPGNTGAPAPFGMMEARPKLGPATASTPIEPTQFPRPAIPQLPAAQPGQPPVNVLPVERPSIEMPGRPGAALPLRQSTVPFTDVGPVRQPQGTLPVHQRFLDAFEPLPQKNFSELFHNLGASRAEALRDWLKQNNMTENYPRLSGAVNSWLEDLNRRRGLGPRGEMLP